MRIKNERDFWAGLLFVVLGIAFAVGATGYDMGPACSAPDPCSTGLWARFAQLSARPGSGYFPLGLAVLLGLLGAVVLFKALTFESEGGDPIGAVAWRPLLGIVGAVVLFGITIEPLGLVLSVAVLAIVTGLAAGGLHWKAMVVNAAVLTAGSWAVFVWGLRLAVPVWPWFAT